MARRHGSGAVKRRADGRWEGQLRLADGTRKYIYARNRRELITRLQEERWRLACGIPVRARGLSLADYAEQWLEVMRCRLRPTTFAGYELCLRRAVSRLGSVPIARLTPQLIQACYAGLLADGLSPRTVFHTHAVLHRALKQARHWGLTSAIPSELVSVPRLPYREMRALSKAQMEVLFETSRETRWYPLWVLLGGWLAATQARLGMPDEARATLTGFSAEREREGGAVAHELVALDAIYNARAVICLMEGDPAATALDVLRDLRDVTPPIDFPAFAFVEAHLLAGIAHLDLGDRNAAAAAAEAALAAAEPDRLIFPFAIDAAELLDALPRHETAHGALLADIVDLLRGEPVPSMDREFLSQPEELSPGELRVLRFLPTNLTRPEIARALRVRPHGQYAHPQDLLQARRARSL